MSLPIGLPPIVPGNFQHHLSRDDRFIPFGAHGATALQDSADSGSHNPPLNFLRYRRRHEVSPDPSTSALWRKPV